ncbi:MAG: exopolysaccharide transport family protein [Xanthobacteraceae bacterium]
MRFNLWPTFKSRTAHAAQPAGAEPSFARPVPPPSVAAAIPAAPSAFGDLDLRLVWRALMRRRAWIVIPTLAAAILSFAAVNLVSPRYKSEARILVDGRENVFLRPSVERNEERASLDTEAVTSQVQIVMSRDLAREIIHKLKLGERPEFDPTLRGVSPLKTILGMFGIGRDPLKLSAEERVLEAYYDRLAVYAVDKSRVIVVEFQSGDPDLAARVANAIAEGYLTMQQGAKQDQARSAGQWLSGEIEGLRKKVAEAEARVEDFRGQASLFVGTNNTTLSNQQLGEINTQLSTARAQKSDAESKARLIRGMLQSGRPIEASEVLNSELVRRLSEQRATLRAQLAEQSTTLLGQHPRIRELRAQIADLDTQLRDEAGKISRSLENDARIAGARMENMNASLDQLKKQAASTNTQDVQLRALEREAKAQRDLLESYLAKFREATTRENIELGPSDGRIISRALVSNTPAFPKKLPIVLIATLATFMLSAGWIVTGELLSMTAPRGAAPIPTPLAMSGQPSFASSVADALPASRRHAEEVVLNDIRQAGAAARKISVLGMQDASATSKSAIALARLLARDASVVLIDLSLRSAEVRAIASEPATPGLTDLVAGTASFGEIITKDRLSRVQIVTGGVRAADPTVLHSPRLTMTIDALQRVYDYVVLDAGALDNVPEHLVATNAHAVLVGVAGLSGDTRKIVSDELRLAGFRGVTLVESWIDPDALTRPDGRLVAA